MSSLLKFFKKKQKDIRFNKLGSGRSLTEPPKNVDFNQSSRIDVPTERAPPSEGALKAAEAAMNRSTAKQFKPKSSAQYQVEAELAKNKKEIEEAETLSSRFAKQAVNIDESVALKRVLFSCPALFGDEFVGSYTEINDAIDQFLKSEAVANLYEACSLMLVRGIALSPLPPGIDVNDDSAPSLQEIHEKRRQNFAKILRNLIEFPDREAYQRLRVSNKLIADLLTVKGAEEFLQTCGFIRTVAPSGEAAGSSGQATKEEEFLVLNAPTEAQQAHLKTMLELIETAEPPMPELNRNTTVMKVTGASLRKLTNDELPAEYFLISRDELRRMIEAQQKAIEESGMLLTKALRERLKTRERRIYRYVLIRVRLPTNLIIQGTFRASETMEKVRLWLSRCFANEAMVYQLWAPPGQPIPGRPMTARVCLDDLLSSTLVDLDLAPCSLLTATSDDPQAQFTLRPDLVITEAIT